MYLHQTCRSVVFFESACVQQWKAEGLRCMTSCFLPAAEKCEEMTDLDLKHSLTGTSLNVRLLFYTRANASCAQLLSHREPFNNSQFNLSSPTTFLIHGYRPTGSPPIWLSDFVKFLLNRRDMNVIVVDWNRGATNINYWKVVDNTRKVAANLTDLIQKMEVKEKFLQHTQ